MEQSSSVPRYTLLTCGHCGNLGHNRIINRHVKDIDDEDMDIHYVTTWDFLLCPACGKPILMEYYREVPDYDSFYEESRETMLYPQSKRKLANIPLSIQKEYEEALRTQKVSLNGCAMLARRTLEAICIYEKAVGSDLFAKIKNLLQTNRIPPLLSDVAHLSRKIGNLGAHVGEVELTPHEVAMMLEFIDTLLAYLYTLPAQIKDITVQLENEPDRW